MSKLELIDAILQDNGNRLRESFFNKNHPDILEEILSFCSINLSHLSFNQKLWHWVNDFQQEYLCKCGNKTTFNKNWKDGWRKYCSAKCSATESTTKEKRKKTNLEKWGVDNVAKAEQVKNKQAETNLERYGTKSSAQNEEVKKKYNQTISEKYGVDNYFESEDFKVKAKETLLKKYGKEHFTQTEEYIELVKQHNIEKYNTEWFTQTEEYKEKAKKTNLEKWGVESYLQTEELRNLLKNNKFEIIEKIKKTSLDKWGVDSYSKSDDFKNKIKEKWESGSYSNMKSKSIITNNLLYGFDWYTQTDEWRKYLKSDEFRDKIKYSLIDKSHEYYKNLGYQLLDIEDGLVTLKGECGHTFKIQIYNASRRSVNGLIICTECNPINLSQSGSEINLVNWLSQYIELETKNRSQIHPFELDIFIPDKKIALEYNGLYWHSEIYKDKKYHLNKLLKCNEAGIDLIQIWEDDWIDKQDIVKSIILSRLGLINEKIGARKCKIEFIENRNLVNDFFDKNHIQGKTNFKYAVGLFYNGELVSCMLFNKPRKEFELVRFANKINIIVNGAASKLFKFFLEHHQIEEIVSFADRATFNGNLYKELGFEFVWRTEPNWWWLVNGKRIHRFTYNKQKLIKMGGDPNKTEVEIMMEMGHSRIFGCGQDKYVFKKSSKVE
jgi:hypothetical protein